MESRQRILFMPFVLILSLALILTGCSTGDDDGNNDGDNGSPAAAAQSQAATVTVDRNDDEDARSTETATRDTENDDDAESTATPRSQRSATPAESEPDDDATPTASTEGTSDNLAVAVQQVADLVIPSVAYISVTVQSTNQFGQQQPQQGVGSGVVIDSSGLILTNNHVIEGATEVTVIMSDGEQYEAQVLGRAPAKDIALLQVDADNLPALPIGDSSELEVGQWVVAVGNALGLSGGPTVTTGVVSALDRTLQPGQGEPAMENLIQVDAAINPGNSGGPLVNLNGEVVGINTAKIPQAEGIGFSIAINDAMDIVDQIQNAEPTATLGVAGGTVTPAVASRYNLPVDEGVLVVEVQPDSAAAEAGLQPGDVITEFDGEAIATTEELRTAIRDHEPGDEVTIAINRDGQERDIDVTLGESNVIQDDGQNSSE